MTEPHDDAVWVARCLSGDSSAFETLVRRYERVVFRVALRLTGSYEDASDITQNAFIRAYERLHTFDPARRFFSWMYRIAVNESLNFRRSYHPGEQLSQDLQAKVDADDAVDRSETRDRIQAALMMLTKEYREVIVLKYFAELSYDEIGQALGIPEKTVKSRLFAARQRLGALLSGTRGAHRG